MKYQRGHSDYSFIFWMIFAAIFALAFVGAGLFSLAPILKFVALIWAARIAGGVMLLAAAYYFVLLGLEVFS